MKRNKFVEEKTEDWNPSPLVKIILGAVFTASAYAWYVMLWAMHTPVGG